MGRKKQAPETSEKRALILKTAGKMFVHQGYTEVSMDAIALAVPVSKRTLYNHFRDKKALFCAVMQGRCQQVFTRMTQSLQEHDGVTETLRAVGHQFLSIVLETDAVDMYRTLITESGKFPELGQLFYETGPKRTRAILAEYLESQDRKGTLQIANPELAAAMFISMLLNRIQMQLLLGIKKQITTRERNDLIQYAVEIFVAGHAVK
jgi:TetR/AcrR family transcriptional repressor of mexJK operon